MSTATTNGKQSIAFPAIGTGILGFPQKEAARIFFKKTKSFARKTPNSSLKEVAFVLFHKDLKTIEAFQNELKQQEEWNGSSDSEIEGASEFRQRFSKSFSTEDDKNNVMSIKVCDDKEIYIVKGDITKETSDVIAHVTNPHLVMGTGVARALSKAGGREIERACELILKRDAPLQFNTVLTTAGNLKANYVAHMVAGNSPSLNEIEKCLKDLFDTVTKLRLESVSLPAVGTGSLNCDPEKVASTLLKSVIRGQQSNPGSPNKVRIVLKEDELVEVFKKAVNGMSEFGDQSWWKRISNYLTGSSVPRINIKPKSPHDSRTLCLSIYAKDEESLRFTITGIMDVIKSHKKKDKFEDDNIKNLSSSQIKDLEDLFLAYNIEATIEEKLDRILMFGHADDIFNVKSEIFKFFKELDKVEKEWKKDEFDHGLASIVSQCVQWYYVDPKTGALVEYDARTNAIIEKAYSNEEKSVQFCLKEQDCEIDFHGMIEKNSSLKVPDLKVIRKDLKG